MHLLLCGHTNNHTGIVATGEVSVKTLGITALADSAVHGVKLRKIFVDRTLNIEFQICRCLQKFFHTFMICNARKLQQDLAILLKFLNIGSDNTECVDTLTEHIGRARDAVLDLLLQC